MISMKFRVHVSNNNVKLTSNGLACDYIGSMKEWYKVWKIKLITFLHRKICYYNGRLNITLKYNEIEMWW